MEHDDIVNKKEGTSAPVDRAVGRMQVAVDVDTAAVAASSAVAATGEPNFPQPLVVAGPNASISATGSPLEPPRSTPGSGSGSATAMATIGTPETFPGTPSPMTALIAGKRSFTSFATVSATDTTTMTTSAEGSASNPIGATGAAVSGGGGGLVTDPASSDRHTSDERTGPGSRVTATDPDASRSIEALECTGHDLPHVIPRRPEAEAEEDDGPRFEARNNIASLGYDVVPTTMGGAGTTVTGTLAGGSSSDPTSETGPVIAELERIMGRHPTSHTGAGAASNPTDGVLPPPGPPSIPKPHHGGSGGPCELPQPSANVSLGGGGGTSSSRLHSIASTVLAHFDSSGNYGSNATFGSAVSRSMFTEASADQFVRRADSPEDLPRFHTLRAVTHHSVTGAGTVGSSHPPSGQQQGHGCVSAAASAPHAAAVPAAMSQLSSRANPLTYDSVEGHQGTVLAAGGFGPSGPGTATSERAVTSSVATERDTTLPLFQAKTIASAKDRTGTVDTAGVGRKDTTSTARPLAADPPSTDTSNPDSAAAVVGSISNAPTSNAATSAADRATVVTWGSVSNSTHPTTTGTGTGTISMNRTNTNSGTTGTTTTGGSSSYLASTHAAATAMANISTQNNAPPSDRSTTSPKHPTVTATATGTGEGRQSEMSAPGSVTSAPQSFTSRSTTTSRTSRALCFTVTYDYLNEPATPYVVLNTTAGIIAHALAATGDESATESAPLSFSDTGGGGSMTHRPPSNAGRSDGGGAGTHAETASNLTAASHSLIRRLHEAVGGRVLGLDDFLPTMGLANLIGISGDAMRAGYKEAVAMVASLPSSFAGRPPRGLSGAKPLTSNAIADLLHIPAEDPSWSSNAARGTPDAFDGFHGHTLSCSEHLHGRMSTARAQAMAVITAAQRRSRVQPPPNVAHRGHRHLEETESKQHHFFCLVHTFGKCNGKLQGDPTTCAMLHPTPVAMARLIQAGHADEDLRRRVLCGSVRVNMGMFAHTCIDVLLQRRTGKRFQLPYMEFRTHELAPTAGLIAYAKHFREALEAQDGNGCSVDRTMKKRTALGTAIATFADQFRICDEFWLGPTSLSIGSRPIDWAVGRCPRGLDCPHIHALPLSAMARDVSIMTVLELLEAELLLKGNQSAFLAILHTAVHATPRDRATIVFPPSVVDQHDPNAGPPRYNTNGTSNNTNALGAHQAGGGGGGVHGSGHGADAGGHTGSGAGGHAPPAYAAFPLDASNTGAHQPLSGGPPMMPAPVGVGSSASALTPPSSFASSAPSGLFPSPPHGLLQYPHATTGTALFAPQALFTAAPVAPLPMFYDPTSLGLFAGSSGAGGGGGGGGGLPNPIGLSVAGGSSSGGSALAPSFSSGTVHHQQHQQQQQPSSFMMGFGNPLGGAAGHHQHQHGTGGVIGASSDGTNSGPGSFSATGALQGGGALAGGGGVTGGSSSITSASSSFHTYPTGTPMPANAVQVPPTAGTTTSGGGHLHSPPPYLGGGGNTANVAGSTDQNSKDTHGSLQQHHQHSGAAAGAPPPPQYAPAAARTHNSINHHNPQTAAAASAQQTTYFNTGATQQQQQQQQQQLQQQQQYQLQQHLMHQQYLHQQYQQQLLLQQQQQQQFQGQMQQQAHVFPYGGAGMMGAGSSPYPSVAGAAGGAAAGGGAPPNAFFSSPPAAAQAPQPMWPISQQQQPQQQQPHMFFQTPSQFSF